MLRDVALVFGILSAYASAQSAECTTNTTNWAFNSQGDSPCDIAADLVIPCTGEFTLQPLQPGFVYLGPTLTNANSCRCSTVYYSLLSACALCQGHEYLRWSSYNPNCTTVYSQVYPSPIPSGLKVPNYAYLDVTKEDNFDPALAQSAGGVESTTVPTSTAAITPSGKSNGSKTNVGAIVGGVVGGIVLLGIVVGLILFWRRRQNLPKVIQSPSLYDPVHPVQPSMAYVPSSFGTSQPQRIYDPNDPSTFPVMDAPEFSSPFLSSSEAHTPPHQVSPSFTGNTTQSALGRTHYTGAPEL